MPTPAFTSDLLAWRRNGSDKLRARYPYVGNQCDGDNEGSVLVSQDVLLALGVVRVSLAKATMGTPLELAIRDDLVATLPALDPSRTWTIQNQQPVEDFIQYLHLAVLDSAVNSDPVLRAEFGRDYRIAPDVVVGVTQDPPPPLLHAVISCKWSMRSDRVQNVRPEGGMLVRHRRGRAPHFVVVTCEPLPSRIASIAMTTGEVDAVYHIAFDETQAAVMANGTQNQQDLWSEMVGQRRLLPYETLASTLALS